MDAALDELAALIVRWFDLDTPRHQDNPPDHGTPPDQGSQVTESG
ncbi:hypothetical protein [Micromonospora lutea]|nr:hypothetical protein [Micromonospora lutea]